MSLCSASSSFTDIPAYTKFHVAIGFTAVAFAAIAFSTKVLTLCGFVERRIPSRLLAAMQIVHPIAGGGYVICAIFMPITANWIWPRLGTPTMVIGFISTMFVSMALGVVAIRIYAKLNAPMNKRAVSNGTVTVTWDSMTKPDDSISPMAQIQETQARRCAWLRIAHVVLMLISWSMIIGAGAAFTSNSRAGSFPYEPTDQTTDSLIGRCFGRNLTDSSAPSWLTGLTCGLGAYCQQSTRGGGANSFCSGA